MRKILFIVTLFMFSFLELSCKYEKSKIVLKNASHCIVVLSDRSISYFQQRTFLPTVFQNSTDGNSFCSNFSTIIGCYDQNRQDYKVCTYINKIQNGTRAITSEDSCTTKNLTLNDSLFNKINFSSDFSNWDSIRIQAEFDEFSIDCTYLKKDIAKLTAKNHLLSLYEEIYLLRSTNIQIYHSDSTNEYPIKIDIYNKGKIVKYSEGNIILILYQSITHLISQQVQRR